MSQFVKNLIVRLFAATSATTVTVVSLAAMFEPDRRIADTSSQYLGSLYLGTDAAASPIARPLFEVGAMMRHAALSDCGRGRGFS